MGSVTPPHRRRPMSRLRCNEPDNFLSRQLIENSEKLVDEMSKLRRTIDTKRTQPYGQWFVANDFIPNIARCCSAVEAAHGNMISYVGSTMIDGGRLVPTMQPRSTAVGTPATRGCGGGGTSGIILRPSMQQEWYCRYHLSMKGRLFFRVIHG